MTTVSVITQPVQTVRVATEPVQAVTTYRKGEAGKSAYQSYLDTTEDNPVLSEIQWSAADTIWQLDEAATIKPVNAKTVDGSHISGELYGGLFQP